VGCAPRSLGDLPRGLSTEHAFPASADLQQPLHYSNGVGVAAMPLLITAPVATHEFDKWAHPSRDTL
jgi:hypothetical protein